jgi:hypothetical protein
LGDEEEEREKTMANEGKEGQPKEETQMRGWGNFGLTCKYKNGK